MINTRLSVITEFLFEMQTLRICSGTDQNALFRAGKKHEIRISKFETNTKSKWPNDKNRNSAEAFSYPLNPSLSSKGAGTRHSLSDFA
jgi:hypothetical protein